MSCGQEVRLSPWGRDQPDLFGRAPLPTRDGSAQWLYGSLRIRGRSAWRAVPTTSVSCKEV